MKNRFHTLIVGLFLTLCVYGQHVAPVRVMTVPSVIDSIKIDGIANENSWSDTSSITRIFNNSGVTGPEDLSGYIRLCYDTNNIYVFISITDDIEYDYDGAGINWTYDNAEVFLDLDTAITNTNGSYIGDETQIRYNRGWPGASTGNAPRNNVSLNNFALTNSDTGWAVEAKIPWLSFMPDSSKSDDFIPWLNKALGFDIQISDNDGLGRDGQGAWDADTNGYAGMENDAWDDTRTFGAINLLPADEKPVASAGKDTTIVEGTKIKLDGSNSYSLRGSYLSYSWNSLDNIALDSTTSVSPQFTAPENNTRENQDYRFVLTINDRANSSIPDTMVVQVKNSDNAPIANAGQDQLVAPNAIVNLDGSLSSDPDTNDLTYSWSSLDGIELNGATTVSPMFIAPDIKEVKNYRFTLVVNDGELNSVADTVTVLVDGTSSVKNSAEINAKISPNPTRDFITINVDNAETKSLQLTIYELNGKVVYSGDLLHIQTIINLKAITKSGVLFVQIEDKATNSKSVQKIIVE